jgi:hypothetical protein
MFDEYPIVGFLLTGAIVIGTYWIVVRLIGG